MLPSNGVYHVEQEIWMKRLTGASPEMLVSPKPLRNIDCYLTFYVVEVTITDSTVSATV